MSASLALAILAFQRAKEKQQKRKKQMADAQVTRRLKEANVRLQKLQEDRLT